MILRFDAINKHAAHCLTSQGRTMVGSRAPSATHLNLSSSCTRLIRAISRLEFHGREAVGGSTLSAEGAVFRLGADAANGGRSISVETVMRNPHSLPWVMRQDHLFRISLTTPRSQTSNANATSL